MSAISQGLGQKGQDWSYLTPIRALFRQEALITTPINIPDYAIIDTTKDLSGTRPIERARNQTLVVYVIPTSGSQLSKDAILYLWKESLWVSGPIDHFGPGSSSSELSSSKNPFNPIGDAGDIEEENKWAIIDAAQHNKNGTNDLSLAFVFPWLPAGRYKAAVGAEDNARFSGSVIIAEQHTE